MHLLPLSEVNILFHVIGHLLRRFDCRLILCILYLHFVCLYVLAGSLSNISKCCWLKNSSICISFLLEVNQSFITMSKGLLSSLLADGPKCLDSFLLLFLFLSSSMCSVFSLILHSNHGRSPPSGSIPVQHGSGRHKCADVPPGPHWNLPVRCAILEETYLQTQGNWTPSFSVTLLK